MITENKIREIVKEEVKYALRDFMEELITRLKFEALPYVTDEEQKEIEDHDKRCRIDEITQSFFSIFSRMFIIFS